MKNVLVISIILLIAISHKTIAQEITMFPGFWSVKYYEDDSQISKKQVESLMNTDKQAGPLWLKSKRHAAIGYIAFGAEIGFLIWQLNNAGNNESQTVPFIGLMTSAGIGLGFTLSANNLKKKAILKYNANRDVSTLKFGPTYNGMGMVLSF